MIRLGSLRGRLGSLYGCRPDVRVEYRPNYVPTHHCWNFWRVHYRVHASVAWWLCGLWNTSGSFRNLGLCLEQCRSTRLSLNPAKWAFGVTIGALLGRIVSREGISVDPRKIKAIIEAPTPKNAKALTRFLEQIRWHSHMLRYLTDFATPLHAVVHHTPFSWTKTEDKAYLALKVMLKQASVVQPQD